MNDLTELLRPPVPSVSGPFAVGTVTAAGPFRVRLDGDTDPLPYDLRSLDAAGPLVIGNRVVLAVINGHYCILGGVSRPQDADWHLVGGAGEPAFANSWVNYNASTHPVAAFRKEAMGLVRITGAVKSGTVAAGSPIFTLPVGYRPAINHQTVLVHTSSGPGVLDIGANGAVALASGGNGFAYLTCISFFAG